MQKGKIVRKEKAAGIISQQSRGGGKTPFLLQAERENRWDSPKKGQYGSLDPFSLIHSVLANPVRRYKQTFGGKGRGARARNIRGSGRPLICLSNSVLPGCSSSKQETRRKTKEEEDMSA